MKLVSKNLFKKLIRYLPILILYIIVFTGFDSSFIFYDINFSFNFAYLLIFFFVLKNPEALSYGLIFFSGIINDIVQNLPIGISSINFLLLCAIAAFIRTRMVLPNLLYDWILFLIAILIVSSINYNVLSIIFESPIRYETLMLSAFITFLIYPIFSKVFSNRILLILRTEDD